MSVGRRIFHGVLAVAAAWFLFICLIQAPAAERPLSLLLLVVASLVWFARSGSLLALAVILPLGPILNFPFLTPDRGIYATEVVLLGAVVAKGIRWLLAGRPSAENLPRSSHRVPVLLWVGFAVAGLAALLVGHGDQIGTVSGHRALRVLFLILALVALFQQLGRDGKVRHRSLQLWTAAAVASVGLVAAGGLVEFLVAVARGGGADEPGSFYWSSVGLAVHIAFLSPLALALVLMRAGGRWRYLTGLAWLLALVCLPLTASRGAMASVIVTTVILVLLTARHWNRTQRRAAWIAAIFLAVVSVILFTKPEIAGESFAYKFRASVTGDFFSTRESGWRDSLAAIRANPLYGEEPEAWAPSMPLELARRYGLVAGVLAMAALLAVAGRIFRRQPAAVTPDVGAPPGHSRATETGLVVSLLGFILVGLAETGLGAQTTPLVTSAICVVGWLGGATHVEASEDSAYHRELA